MQRPKSKRLVKAQERFKAAVIAYIVGRGAKPDTFYDYRLATPAGPLNITVYDNWIACRFDDLVLGSAFSQSCFRPCNPYSGKWNFHYADCVDLDVAMADFSFSLETLLSGSAIPGDGG